MMKDKIRKSLLTALYNTIALIVVEVIINLLMLCFGFQDAFEFSWRMLIGIIAIFIFCFIIDLPLRLIFKGRRPDDGVSDDAEPIS